VAAGTGVGLFGLGSLGLDLPFEAGFALGLASALVSVILALLPETGGALNRAMHVLITFQFTVLSRVFFRADDFESAKVMVAKLVSWDLHGVRPGLFRWPAAVELCEQELAGRVPPALSAAAGWAAEHGLALLLLLGLGYHFTPRRWVDEGLAGAFARLPALVIGVVLAVVALALMKVLEGPRANIYFAF
jgi:hypothetical protein